MQTVRHYFPGGNTPEGFFSYYDQILQGDPAGNLAVIKGGPGCGKSTFMKQLGKKLEEQGEDVCYLHCSSDPDSLDGVMLPDYRTAIIDGTAPHIVDARYPGVCDTVFNFCEFIDRNAIAPMRDTVLETNARIQDAFGEGYRYLSSASKILEQMQWRSRDALAEEEGNRFCLDTLKRLSVSSGLGSRQQMFLSAITPCGFRNYIDDALKDRYVVMLRTETGDAAFSILEQLAQLCRAKHFDIQCFSCPMNPRHMEHLVIPSANFAVTVSNRYHTYEHPDEVVYFSDFCQKDYDNSRDALLYEQLLDSAVSAFSRAKALHDRLEQCYIPYVDFQSIGALTQSAMNFLTRVSQ